MSPSATDLQLLVLPAPGADLVLPAAAVGEIVRVEDLGPPPAVTPDWVMGTLSWRGQQVSVVRLVESSGPGDRPHTVVVCFAPSGDRSLPHLAIASPGLPHLERVIPENLAPEPGTPQGVPWFVVTALRFNARPVWLLHLAALERALLDGSARVGPSSVTAPLGRGTSCQVPSRSAQ